MLRCAVGDGDGVGGRSLLGRQGQIGGTRLEGRRSGPAGFVQFVAAAAAVGTTSATSATRWCCCCGGGFRVMMILIVFVLWWMLLRLRRRRLFCVSFIATSDR